MCHAEPSLTVRCEAAPIQVKSPMAGRTPGFQGLAHTASWVRDTEGLSPCRSIQTGNWWLLRNEENTGITWPHHEKNQKQNTYAGIYMGECSYLHALHKERLVS